MTDEPRPDPLEILEQALATACHTLAKNRSRPELDQEWIPPWRLPQTAPEWISYWILSSALTLHEALMAYRHSTTHHGQLRLLPDPDRDSHIPS